jgi:hypothetical protein
MVIPLIFCFIDYEDTAQEQGLKAALSQCEKSIKKFPTALVLTSLKAFLLIQNGKDQEGIDLAKEIAKKEPIDRLSLEYLEKVFVSINDCIFRILPTFIIRIKISLLRICMKLPLRSHLPKN